MPNNEYKVVFRKRLLVNRIWKKLAENWLIPENDKRSKASPLAIKSIT